MNQTTEKPFALACERNQVPILEVMSKHLRTDDQWLLELGSGTGQHAVYLADKLPQLSWQTSDVSDNHTGIQMWLDEAQLPNVLSPVSYEVGKDPWPTVNADLIFTANTLHIMAANLVELMIKQMHQGAGTGTRMMIYGPFKYGGEYTSESNADFDVWLKGNSPSQGIRDFEWVQGLLANAGFEVVADVAMPANNQFLVFDKIRKAT